MTLINHPRKHIGLSTDTKPTEAANSPIPSGSTFYEYDTGILFITYDGTNWVTKVGSPSGASLEVSTTQEVAAAGNYDINDVLCNNASTGIPWNFADVVGANGGRGYITKAQITVETTGQAHRLTLFLFSETPTSELDDNVTNTGPADADRGFYLGKIDFPALESLGAGNSDTLAATSSPTSGIPFAFACAVADVDLYGILVTRDAFTNETVDDEYVITLTVEAA